MKIRAATSILLCIIFISGCVHPAKKIRPEVQLPAYNPKTNFTSFSNALKNIGQMSNYLDNESIYIAIKPVRNESASGGKVPEHINMMVNTAIVKMGGSFTLLEYDEAAVSKKISEGKIVFVINGAITDFDENIVLINDRFDLGGYYKEADAEYGNNNNRSISAVGLDFTLMNVTTGEYLKEVFSSNRMEIQSMNKNREIGFSIVGNGLGVSSYVSSQNGIHAAIRLLVELSLVELIGKWKQYPYWVAIPGKKLEKNVKEKMMADFIVAPKKEQIIQIQRLLSPMHKGRMPTDGILTPLLERGIIEFKSHQNIMPINSQISVELYMALLDATCYLLQNKYASWQQYQNQ